MVRASTKPRTPGLTRCVVENGGWDTSKALVRRTLERCIQVGRQARSGGNKVDTYESYRLLGQAVSLIYSRHVFHLIFPCTAAHARRLPSALQLLRAGADQDGLSRYLRARRRPSKGSRTRWSMGSAARHGYVQFFSIPALCADAEL